MTSRAVARFAPGLGLLVVGGAPLLIAATAWHMGPDGHLAGSGLSGECPLLAATGIPCAGCGASRAFYFLTHGDGAFLDYNWVWPVLALAALGYGVLLTWRAGRGHAPLGAWARATVDLYARRPLAGGVGTAALILIPWAAALVNLEAIRGY